ncbi:MAG: EamA family transporter RarD [Spirochaetia bacterium]
MIEDRRTAWSGTLFALLSFLIWGFLPLYWKGLGGVPAIEMLAHRVFWAGAVLIVVVPLFQWRELRVAFRDRPALLAATLAGLLLAANWFIYIWAISVDRLVEASLGYYINPLVNVLLGVVFLRERLTRLQTVALAFAAAGVLVLTFSHGQFPWISIALGFSFGIYGLVKKVGRLNSLVSLLVELLLVAPVAGIYILIIQRAGQGSFAVGNGLVTGLLAGAGIVTVTPLLLFGAGARRIPLSRVGFLQYVAPTIILLIGTVLYDEPFTRVHAVSFTLIWVALAIYTVTIVPVRGGSREK